MPCDRLRRIPAPILVFSVLTAVFSSATASAQPPPGVTGKLDTVRGIRVLKLWGDDRNRGYAHGYLLADEIMEFMNSSLLMPKLIPEAEDYENHILPTVAEKFEFDARRTAELDGMLLGIKTARAVKGIRLDRLGRDLTRADLEALNSLADWIRLGCSSFSAWGSVTRDQETITARNLDYLDLPGLRKHHVVIVFLEPGPGARSWVSISWPGLIGAYTAMNEDGVTLTMHDAEIGIPPTHRGKFVPRSYALRAAIEKASAVSAVKDVERALRDRPSLTANNFHASGPFKGQRNPAAVFEYDGDVSRDGGVTVRFAADEKSAALMNILLCTNHYRKRDRAEACYRFEIMRKFFETPRPATDKIDVNVAWQVLRSVAVPGTMHSVVFLPNRQEFYVSFATATNNATEARPVHFTLAELLKR